MAKKKAARKSKRKPFTVSIDLGALDKLYRNRYVVSLRDGDTKGGSVRLRDGDTKGGALRIRDGDTKGGARSRGSKKPRRKR
jgi:hypothetical protein